MDFEVEVQRLIHWEKHWTRWFCRFGNFGLGLWSIKPSPNHRSRAS